MLFHKFFAVAVTAMTIVTSVPVNADRLIGNYQAKGHVTITPQSSEQRDASREGRVLDGDSISAGENASTNVRLDNRDGFLTVGENTRARITTKPGYLVEADGDRIDFGFRYGKPFAVQMGCYVVRPHPLQLVSKVELISGSIIRDETGIYVLGRNGRLDVTVDGSYVAREFERGEIQHAMSVSQPDRLHIVDKHDRVRGCGDAYGSVAAIPRSCGAGG